MSETCPSVRQLARKLVRGGCVIALLLCSACGRGETIAGSATVVDGDGLVVAGRTVRLFGIDAPEGVQTCGRGRQRWPCGQVSAAALDALTAGKTVTCERRDTDQYGRFVGICAAGGIDLGESQVRSGMALAYRRFSDVYVPAEDAAKLDRRGIWEGEFEPPSEFRRRSRAAPGEPTGDCRIKGNISRDGQRIYHVEGSPSYAATRIDTRAGERWFCSEAEARSAGWRPPR